MKAPTHAALHTRFEHLDAADFALPDDFEQRFLTPALVVFLDRLRENLAWIQRALDGNIGRWRPHVKTTKIPAIFREIAAVGVRHFKAATTREAFELLSALRNGSIEGADVCLAYPLRSAALARLGTLARAFPEARLSVLVEDSEALAQVPEGVDVFIDVNPGMNRTGVPLADRKRLASLVRESAARLRGLHFYDGHLHEGDAAQRRALAFAGYDQLMELVTFLGLEQRPLELVTSGTPTFLHALAYEPFRGPEGTGPVHRVSPGTVVYHDLRSEQENEELHLAPAAQVVAQVISHPTRKLATCNAGSKSIAAEAGDPAAFVLGHAQWTARTPSEEHLPLHIADGALPARGELLQLIPRHVCPTINLAEEAVLIEGGEVRDVVSVSARAHELRVDGL